MSYRGHNVLAVVPARGGSKGIPRKNLQIVGGETLIAHVANVARSLDWLDAAVLSTDDQEIAAEGRRCGLEVPFLRPAELASDRATAADTWRHAWLESERAHGKRFELSVYLEPTSPLRRAGDVEATVALLLDRGTGGAATVGPIPAHHCPERTLLRDDAGRIRFYAAEGARITRRQDIPTYYTRNGVCYAVRRSYLVDQGQIIGDDCAALVIDRPVVNIDDPIDVDLADLLLRRQAHGGGDGA